METSEPAVQPPGEGETPGAIDFESKTFLRDQLRRLLGEGAWSLDFVRVENGYIEIGGWGIAPDRDIRTLGFSLNGKLFDFMAYPVRRDDLQQFLWYVPDGPECGFICRMHSTDLADATGIATFSFVDKETGVPVRREHNYYYDLNDDPFPLPEPARRVRVHGAEGESSFRIEGFSNFSKLRLVLRKYFDKDYGDFTRVLDWGCGCGRFLRHFRGYDTVNLTGIDIDSDNVSWCQQNLPFASFETVPLHPPTGLPSGEFDLLIGISVFTHLGEQDQFEWLAELRRVARPEAILLMSIHADSAVSRQQWNAAEVRQWLVKGIVAGPSGAFDGVLEEAEYYKNTLHTREYIHEHWGKYFEVVDIVPSCVGNLQDLVIMKKRRE